MKKSIAVALILAFVLCGCSSGITQEEYDALVAERDAAQNEIAVLNGQIAAYEQMLDEHDELISQRDTALAENEILREQIAELEGNQQADSPTVPEENVPDAPEAPSVSPVETPATPPSTGNPELTSTGPITITKDPYTERVVEGNSTWFIAHAENWDTVEWFLVSPIDGKTYTVEEVSAMYPTLTLRSNTPDTISLINIPLEFNGWQFFARFSNADTSVDTALAEVKVFENVDESTPESSSGIGEMYIAEGQDYYGYTSTYCYIHYDEGRYEIRIPSIASNVQLKNNCLTYSIVTDWLQIDYTYEIASDINSAPEAELKIKEITDTLPNSEGDTWADRVSDYGATYTFYSIASNANGAVTYDKMVTEAYQYRGGVALYQKINVVYYNFIDYYNSLETRIEKNQASEEKRNVEAVIETSPYGFPDPYLYELPQTTIGQLLFATDLYGRQRRVITS